MKRFKHIRPRIPIRLEREQAARLLTWGVRFFLTAALTSSRTPGGYAPFALGCVAVSGSGGEGVASLLGAGVGAALFFSFGDALPFLATAVLLVTASTAFQGMALMRKRWFPALLSGGLSLAVGGIYVIQSLAPLTHVAPWLASSVLTGLSAWFDWPLLQPGQERLDPNSLLVLASSLFLSVGDVTVLDCSIGRMALCALLLYTAYQRGASVGAAAGLGIGLAADFCTETGGMLCGAMYGLASLAAGHWSGGRRSVSALSFLLGAAAAMLPAAEEQSVSLLVEAAVGTILFLGLPGRCFGGKRVKREEPKDLLAATPALDRLRGQLTRMAAALRDLYDSMNRGAPLSSEENPAIVFDRAAEKVCRGCALCQLCWQKEYSGTFNALNDATPYLLERGRALAKDFPSYFTGRCVHLPDFLNAINGELSAFLLRQQYRRQLEETRKSARGQYAQLSELLTATAAGLGAERAVAGQVRYQVGAALRPKAGESACGDTVSSFETDSGLLCLLLADGMGCGEAARKESTLACRLIRQFLEAGIEPEAALKTLNSAMNLRSADTGSFTTIDLMTCRPESGQTTFYKFGAAPSYLKKGGRVRRVTGGALPAGLRNGPAPPDVTHVTLEQGAFAVMVSDGVADASRDEWLQDLLAGWEGDDPQTLAGLILRESVRRDGLQDDCGIQVLYLTKDVKTV